LLGPSSSVEASPIALYTFEQFSGLAFTPLVNVAPDSGPAGFLATFTSSPAPTGFAVNPFQANGLFSGVSLIEPAFVVGNTLSVTLNQPIFSVTTAFATNGPGALTFGSSVGGISVVSTPQSGGASFPGGTLTFSSLVGFTSFTLSAGASPEFAIDNLQLDLGPPPSEVPEPSTLVLLGIGAAGAVARRRRMNRRRTIKLE
jgi:hypothetical protein